MDGFVLKPILFCFWYCQSGLNRCQVWQFPTDIYQAPGSNICASYQNGVLSSTSRVPCISSVVIESTSPFSASSHCASRQRISAASSHAKSVNFDRTGIPPQKTEPRRIPVRCSRVPQAKAGCYQDKLVSALLFARITKTAGKRQ